MEIPMINRITSDFDIALKNPTYLSQILALSGSGFDQLYRQRYNFVTWGALIIALLASLTTLITRLNLFIIKIRSRSLYNYQPILNGDDFDYDESDSDTSDDEDEEDEDEDEEDEDFEEEGQNGNFILKRCRNGKSVMKFWDNLGFNFSSDNLIALYDSVSFNGGETSSDTRAASKKPSSILAEWMPINKQDLFERVNNNIAGFRGAYKSALANYLTEVDDVDDDVWWDAGVVVDRTELVTTRH
ncbi:hypothetical protein ACFE04_016614 [Oxalis oulophora]